MESLNIAFYTDTFFPAVDGVVTSIKNFTEELEKRGHNVYIFTAGKKNGESLNGSANVFFAKGIRFRKYPQYTLAMFPFLSATKARRLKIDIAHVQTPFAMGWTGLVTAKINKTPLVGSFHTLFTDKAVIKEYIGNNSVIKKVANKYSWKYAKFFYNKCNTVIAPSASIERLLHKKGIRNTEIVGNGIDMRLFNTKVNGSAVRRKLIDGEDRKIVLYVGRISREKKIDVLIKAAQRLRKKDILFIAVGNGPAFDYYNRMVDRYKLNRSFKFLGFVENESLAQYYAACDVFCIPSTFETQGIVSLEAMACGKPVVGADYLALSELIRNGRNGEKFVPNSSIDCTNKIERVINNIDRYKEMTDTAKEYSVEKTTDRLLKVYKDLTY